MIVKKVLRIRRHKGYEVRTELIDGQPYGCPDVQVKNAYTPDGKYIGEPKMALQIVAHRGIAPEYCTPESGVCTIGFSEKNQKWYGWSHRAIRGFGIGDRVKYDEMFAPTALIADDTGVFYVLRTGVN